MTEPPIRDEALRAALDRDVPYLGIDRQSFELGAEYGVEAALALVATRIQQIPILLAYDEDATVRALRRADVLAALGVAPATPEPPDPALFPTHEQVVAWARENLPPEAAARYERRGAASLPTHEQEQQTDE